MCSMSLTVVVSDRSNGVVIRPDIWSGGKPVYCQTTPITGIRISGRMSVGVRSVASGPIINSSSASTTKVYGRLSAIRTNAIIKQAFPKQTEIGQPGGQFVALIYPNCGRKPTPATPSASLPRHPIPPAQQAAQSRGSGSPYRVQEVLVSSIGVKLGLRKTSANPALTLPRPLSVSS